LRQVVCGLGITKAQTETKGLSYFSAAPPLGLPSRSGAGVSNAAALRYACAVAARVRADSARARCALIHAAAAGHTVAAPPRRAVVPARCDPSCHKRSTALTRCAAAAQAQGACAALPRCGAPLALLAAPPRAVTPARSCNRLGARLARRRRRPPGRRCSRLRCQPLLRPTAQRLD
jgi:hypothetical protein